jgi:hypothetical protein
VYPNSLHLSPTSQKSPLLLLLHRHLTLACLLLQSLLLLFGCCHLQRLHLHLHLLQTAAVPVLLLHVLLLAALLSALPLLLLAAWAVFGCVLLLGRSSMLLQHMKLANCCCCYCCRYCC